MPPEQAPSLRARSGRQPGDASDRLAAIAEVLDRGIPDDRKLATITRLVYGPLPVQGQNHEETDRG